VFVTHLQLADFRSYTLAEVPLEAGVTTFVGANGQGKTNLVEAVEYLSTLSSHRVASEVPLIRAGAQRAIIRARVQAGRDDHRVLTLEIELSPGRANSARLNRSPLKRSRELVGLLRTVVFSPEDLAIIKGDPAERRAFLDAVVINRWPRLAGVKADYDRVLRQRNTLLKSLSGRRHGRSGGAEAEATLEAWDTHLAEHGAELVRCRLLTLADLRPHVSSAYEQIAPTNNVAVAAYKTSLPLGHAAVLIDVPGHRGQPEPADQADQADQADLADLADGAGTPSRPGLPDRARVSEAIRSQLIERRGDELARGLTLVGPHRDDVTLQLGDLPARGYASHGESWSYALALRLGAFELLRADGIEPVLVLDDVFAELDATRRERLAAMVAPAEQVLVTAAVGSDVPAVLKGRRFTVAGGEVTPQ